ncbi:MAG: hypothetical protein F7C08_03240 [Desulfurococcales archaeon]|nr:hypothetical protein [Desulfurococcales archaeon]MCE4605527.1 hypothetical protein [Desulfurococcales archaeon]
MDVLGLYTPYRQGATHRRITGGPPLKSQGPIAYLGIAIVYPPLLTSLLGDVEDAARSAGMLIHGGELDAPGARGVVGVTKLGNVGVVEVLAEGDAEAPLILAANIFKSHTVREHSISGDVRASAGGYRSPTWVRYGGGPTRSRGEARRGPYYIGFTANMHDVYLSDVRVYGNFYASPPMEPYNLAVRLEGTQLNELMFYQIKLAWRDRAELAGIDYEQVDEALDRLYEALELDGGR